MSPHQVIAVAIRLFAIWLFAVFAMNVPYFFMNTPVRGEIDSVLAFVLSGAAVALLALGLWRFPLTVASKLLSPGAEPPSDGAEPDTWLAMGCALMGLWLLAKAISSIARDLMLFTSGFEGGYYDDAKLWVGLYLPETIIGLWLVFGAKGFRRLFWWARNAGRSAPSEASAEATSNDDSRGRS